MSSQARSICIGEATIELARGGDGRFTLGCSGDTFNTAIYLARAGQSVAFASALGDDAYSERIAALASAEGVDTDLILRAAGRLPGLALVEADGKGGRRIDSWCDAAPAHELFELPTWSRIAEALTAARLVYFSGITLSLYSNIGIGRFLAAVEIARSQGAKIAFDGNFRPRGWKGDLSRARTVFAEALKRVDIALPAYDDEAVLWGDPSPRSDHRAAASLRRQRDRGEERAEQRAGRCQWRARNGAGAGCRNAGRSDRSGRWLQRRLSRGKALRRRRHRSGGRRAQARR